MRARSEEAATAAIAVACRALAMVDGQAWIVASDDDAVRVTYDGKRFSVVPCGPGWPATTQRILAKHGLERSN